ncbi:M23 family metallopeptidase [Campylobacter pinnipediorum]|uniref:M23 family metallopeptidase n=1 Tax=Campylobacter pinnipediorum TaxID=1965231 RepID=UPI00084D326E|nr:zinc metallopeptidase, M23 family [Campylobacter pinnipediorum subsp. pinnipediorum]AQW84908.1 zinc metallopeptidase, M23 family [Campylobacter pinnipediorum subsp. pinnipediorum]OPA79762.1 peptidase M23 [Campylobacter pinnipediorum subsp. pinnipediorum]
MRRRGFNAKSFVVFLILFLVLGCSWYILTSKEFEKNAPQILIQDKIYWNLKTPLNVKFKDDSGIKFLRISMSDGQNNINILNQLLSTPMREFDVNLTIPKTSFFSIKDKYTMSIEATDTSKWNFFTGNKTNKNVEIILDTTKPDVYVLSNSYSISNGGAATVVFKATDNDLKDVYIQTNYGKKFIPTPFYKEGYYAALIAWPVSVDNFSAEVVALDNAGNETKSHIRYFYKKNNYRTSTIPLRDSFLDGKISQLAEVYSKSTKDMSRLEKMKFINEDLRNENTNKISKITSVVSKEMINKFYLNTFYPLKNAKKVADFADHRFYTYNNQQVSEAWHMGLDLASVAAARIISSNDGRVVFVGDNGIYGLNIIIDHGFGLYSLYAHCSSAKVKLNDTVKAGDHIANTGTSGLALGDHLHFGILVQGEEVRPQQWFDNKWMKDNITDVLNVAKKIIDRN